MEIMTTRNGALARFRRRRYDVIGALSKWMDGSTVLEHMASGLNEVQTNTLRC